MATCALGGLLPLRELRPVLRQDPALQREPVVDFIANRYSRTRRFGWWVVARQSPNHLGLIDLNGIVIPPRPHRPRHRER
jgi:hypothetical protein